MPPKTRMSRGPTSLETLRRQFSEAWPVTSRGDRTQVVAVSGGPDSVALLRLLLDAPLPGRLVVAHFDHRLRPDSGNDCRFVEALAGSWGLEFCSRAAEGPAPSAGEAAFRAARYRFLREAAEQRGARYVLTAHSADDQAETIVHRVLRGTGPRGLRGMRRVRPLGPAVTLVRPLLEIRRQALVEYLDELGQPYCTDASNRDPRYTRNRLRHGLLPMIEKKYNPRVVEALLRLGQLAGEMYDEWQVYSADRFEAHVHVAAPDQVTIQRQGLPAWSMLAVTELLAFAWRHAGWPEQEMGYDEWQRLAQMAATGDPRLLSLPKGVTAEMAESRLVIRRVQPT